MKSPSEGSARLYDRRSDREGKEDVAAQHPEVMKRLGAILDELESGKVQVRESGRSPVPQRDERDTSDAVDRLRALGYVDCT